MNEAELKLKRKELGILIFRTFTKELIINSGPVSIAKLKTIVERDRETFHHKEPRKKVDIHAIHEARRKKMHDVLEERKLRQQIIQREQIRRVAQQKENVDIQKFKLNVPETKLPERFHYLRPTPIQKDEEFGPKIDILIQDPNVEAIECPGENEEVIVRGLMGEQKTEIKLSKKEIDDLINKFSELTKIPATEGIYKVVFGDLILLAVVSEVVGSKFLIKKMKRRNPMPMQMNQFHHPIPTKHPPTQVPGLLPLKKPIPGLPPPRR